MQHLEALGTPISQFVSRLIQGLRRCPSAGPAQAIEGLDVTETTWEEWLDTVHAATTDHEALEH